MYCNHVRYIVLGDQSLVSSYYNSEIMGDDVGRRKVSSGLGTDCGQRVLLEQCLSVNQKAIALEEDVIHLQLPLDSSNKLGCCFLLCNIMLC